MDLPDIYQRWERERVRTVGQRSDGCEVDDGRHSIDPAEPAMAAATLEDIFGPDDADLEVRAMFELQQRGYSLTEIAELLTAAGCSHSEGRVRTRMTHTRTAARRRARD